MSMIWLKKGDNPAEDQPGKERKEKGERTERKDRERRGTYSKH